MPKRFAVLALLVFSTLALGGAFALAHQGGSS